MKGDLQIGIERKMKFEIKRKTEKWDWWEAQKVDIKSKIKTGELIFYLFYRMCFCACARAARPTHWVARKKDKSDNPSGAPSPVVLPHSMKK